MTTLLRRTPTNGRLAAGTTSSAGTGESNATVEEQRDGTIVCTVDSDEEEAKFMEQMNPAGGETAEKAAEEALEKEGASEEERKKDQ
jgi:hypothetical protein